MSTQAPQQMNAADSHGAVDLTPAQATSASTETGDDEGVRLDAPLIMVGTEENFQEVMATSQTVPVVIALWSGRSLESKPTILAVEELVRDYAGRFQFVRVDIDAAPQIAQAFQIQAVPTFVALVGGRPVPLFQGGAPKEQIRPVIDRLLEAAGQMGVTGRIVVSDEQIRVPTPAEHEAPLAAEAEGRFEDAIAMWEKIIKLNPRDGAAKEHVSRVRLTARSQHVNDDDPASVADSLFEAGDQERAFVLLLGLIRDAANDEDRERARLRLIDLFRIAGNTPAVMKARMELSTLILM